MRRAALFFGANRRKVGVMTRLRDVFFVSLVFLFAHVPGCRAEQPARAGTAFNAYVSRVEARLSAQHASPGTFLAGPQDEARLRAGQLIIQPLTPASSGDSPGAMLHHWRGSAFARGARNADFERLMKDVNAYPQHFAPQVIRAQVVAGQGDHYQAKLRVRQKHVLTVVLDTTYDVTFARLDPHHGYSLSRSTQISEVDSPGTSSERVLSTREEHGFLWRINTYWSYEERDGGLYLQVESVSLTRSVPPGLAWAVRPFVDSVPRESIEFTLRATCNALRK